ncbi:MAG: hypothetical protein IPJ50_19890 [Betaproteobacteria bacterium]|jgi:hypothetical protein|nr:hypothetical protein [Betaproteobacteria bacterium]
MPGHIQILFIGSAQESDARFFTRKPGDLVNIPYVRFSNSSALFEPVGIGFMPESNKILEMAVSSPMLKTMTQLRKYSKKLQPIAKIIYLNNIRIVNSACGNQPLSCARSKPNNP